VILIGELKFVFLEVANKNIFLTNNSDFESFCVRNLFTADGKID
jgi:hypothetical protein